MSLWEATNVRQAEISGDEHMGIAVKWPTGDKERVFPRTGIVVTVRQSDGYMRMHDARREQPYNEPTA